MSYIETLKKRFTKDEWIVIFTVLSFSLPAYICVPIFLIETIYLLYTKRFINAYKNTPKAHYLIIFGVLSVLVSLWHQNWLGVACSAFIFILIVLLLFYRQVITKDVFEIMIDILIASSILWAIYGFYEYLKIIQFLGYDHFIIKIFSRREYRFNSVFYNANYYAMMIEFILLLLMYKFFTTKNSKKNIYYILVAIINLAILYLSGCRTAFPAVAIGAIAFLIINKNYKYCLGIGVGCAVVVGYFIINPSQIPRIAKLISNYSTRIDIWTTAIQGIKAHPLFGQGPMTYMLIFEQYGGHNTHHAHSLYLDPILCFGVVGVSTLVPYIYNNCKSLFFVYKQKPDRSLVALTIGCVLVVLIHGTLDYTIFFIHTGLLFVFIASTFSIYTRNKD